MCGPSMKILEINKYMYLQEYQWNHQGQQDPERITIITSVLYTVITLNHYRPVCLKSELELTIFTSGGAQTKLSMRCVNALVVDVAMHYIIVYTAMFFSNSDQQHL